MNLLSDWFSRPRPTQGGPSPERVARAEAIGRRGVVTVPEAAAPTPLPLADSPCGACGLPREGHGTRYAWSVGPHEWFRREPGCDISSLHPLPVEGDPR